MIIKQERNCFGIVGSALIKISSQKDMTTDIGELNRRE